MEKHTYQDILFQQDGPIAILTINRPQVLNALRTQTKNEFSDALDVVKANPDVKVLIITGTGRAFISGSDINEIGIDRPGEETAKMSAHMHQLLNKLAAMPMPVVAAVNGYALGGGLELALACDLCVCCPEAKLGLPEVDLGVLPCYGGTQRLPRAVGVNLAKEMLFTGRMLTAEEAKAVGLVSKIFPKETLLEDTKEWTKSFLNKSATALHYAKICVDEGMELSLQEGLALEAKVAGILVETPEAKENVTVFLNKRNKK